MASLPISVPLDVRVVEGDLPIVEALADFHSAFGDAGAIVSFTGNVRPENDVLALELSHYEALTLIDMQAMVETAFERFALEGALAWHRIGVMTPGDPIVLVATAARHRRDAFAAAEYLMDHLKSAAWLWKREKRADGWHWIEPRPQDHSDRARWK